MERCNHPKVIMDLNSSFDKTLKLLTLMNCQILIT